MAAYFECSNCGNIAPIQSTPPKCPACGRGNGMILSRDDSEEVQPSPTLVSDDGKKK